MPHRVGDFVEQSVFDACVREVVVGITSGHRTRGLPSIYDSCESYNMMRGLTMRSPVTQQPTPPSLSLFAQNGRGPGVTKVKVKLGCSQTYGAIQMGHHGVDN